MATPVDDQVVDFYHSLFDSIFTEPFSSTITERLRRNEMVRRVEEAADAASQALTRFFLNQELTEEQINAILNKFELIPDQLSLDRISNANVTPEVLVQELLLELPVPGDGEPQLESAYRVALHSVVQVLMLVGPVMAEWQKLGFATTFELLRLVINRLNQISGQLDAIGRSGQAAADGRYELLYRDYLLQKFYQVEAGTVRMTTNLNVDLRQLFVMPRIRARVADQDRESGQDASTAELMDLAAARSLFQRRAEPEGESAQEQDDDGIIASDQVKLHSRNVLVGAPGSGKSTFLEWLQLQVASVEEEYKLGGQQAIPLLVLSQLGLGSYLRT